MSQLAVLRGIYSIKLKEPLIEKIKASKGNALIKESTFITEIIWAKKSYTFPNNSKRENMAFRKGLFLFGMVRRDAKKWLEANGSIKLPKKNPTSIYNRNFNDITAKITATDLNHAYWRIAFNEGIISEKTYNAGLRKHEKKWMDDQFKSIRLAALSTLGRGRSYLKIEKGQMTTKVHTVGYDAELEKIYTLIRYTCYKYMVIAKKMLGDDFVGYKTDCIYYVKTKENEAKIRELFSSKDLLMKQLY